LAQDTVPEVSSVERELYRRRTKASKKRESKVSTISRKINPSDPPEFTRRNRWFGDKKDGFGEYMGRDYDSDTFFEVGTMGIEGILFQTYPIERDEGVRDLVLGMLVSL
jgi:hypothetical protein